MKRATKKLVGDLDYKIISIHALVKRATDEIIFVTGGFTDFNPRPREEGDRKVLRP